ncbi:MAG: hypothetical protein J4F46_10320, partial [Dehalococcoidia bacterium]|nr:hypothetical protein [Dehalococcoidia bacterium]
MRNGLLLGGLALVVAVAALVVGIVALLLPASDSDGVSDDIEFHLSDPGEFTVDLVAEALRRYNDEGREATVSYYNSSEGVDGEWYVFIFDEDEKL